MLIPDWTDQEQYEVFTSFPCTTPLPLPSNQHTTQRWRAERRDEESERLRAQEEKTKYEEAKVNSNVEALSREGERRQEKMEAVRKDIQKQKEVVAARLNRGEFRLEEAGGHGGGGGGGGGLVSH